MAVAGAAAPGAGLPPAPVVPCQAQPLSPLPKGDEATGVPRDGRQRVPRSCLVTPQHTHHSCGVKDVAQAVAGGYRQGFESFAALGSCSLTTAVPSRETGSPWDPPNLGLALPLPAEPTASDGHLPRVLIRQRCGVRTCPAMAGTCPVCTVLCDRVAFAELPLSSLPIPAPPRPLTQAGHGKGQSRVTPSSLSQDFLALTPSAANGRAARAP